MVVWLVFGRVTGVTVDEGILMGAIVAAAARPVTNSGPGEEAAEDTMLVVADWTFGVDLGGVDRRGVGIFAAIPSIQACNIM